MISLIVAVLEAAFWLVLLALMIGLLSGAGVMIWRTSRATLAFAYKFGRLFPVYLFEISMTALRERFADSAAEDPPRSELARLQAQIHSLQYALAEALGRAAGLSDLVEDLRRQVQASGGGPGHELYARVGLHDSAPDYLLFAARREFRRRLHPDTQPDGEKAAFTRRFQAVEEAFADIWSRRGLR